MSLDYVTTSIRNGNLSNGKLFESSWTFFKAHIKDFSPAILGWWIVVNLVQVVLVGFPFISLILSLLSGIFSIYVIGRTHEILFTGHTTAPTNSDLPKALNLLIPYLLTNLIAGVIIGIGTLLLIIPGIMLSVYFCFVVQAIIIREKKGLDALQYSYQLILGKWWDVALTMFFFGLITSLYLLLIFGIPYLIIYIAELEETLPYFQAIAGPFLSTFSLIGATILFLNMDPSPPIPVYEESMELVSDFDEF